MSQGTFFGALLAAPFADILGRRMGLLVAVGVVFNFGVVLQTASTSQPLFIAGRFFAGLGVGLLSAMSTYSFPCNRDLYKTRSQPSHMHLADTTQSPCTNPRLRQSGSVV